LGLIACGLEEVSAFGGGEEIHDFSESLADGIEAACFRSSAFSLEKTISMGLRSEL
jgi:hypothetical protein|tara:strand:+ start:406 stop:573 length:168 start_codon:yes stop_codon:yes gene_type:complete